VLVSAAVSCPIVSDDVCDGAATKDGNTVVDCFVREVSATGARLELRQDVPLPKSFVLVLTDNRSVPRVCQTVWQLSIVWECDSQRTIDAIRDEGVPNRGVQLKLQELGLQDTALSPLFSGRRAFTRAAAGGFE
jgi:hypothetical protein